MPGPTSSGNMLQGNFGHAGIPPVNFLNTASEMLSNIDGEGGLVFDVNQRGIHARLDLPNQIYDIDITSKNTVVIYLGTGVANGWDILGFDEDLVAGSGFTFNDPGEDYEYVTSDAITDDFFIYKKRDSATSEIQIIGSTVQPVIASEATVNGIDVYRPLWVVEFDQVADEIMFDNVWDYRNCAPFDNLWARVMDTGSDVNHTHNAF